MSFGVGLGDIIKLCEIATRVYKNCRDCTGEYKSLTAESRNLTNLLEDIRDKFESIPESKNKQFVDAYGTCVDVISDLDAQLVHYNSLDTKSKRAWDRLRWDPDTSRTLRQRLTSSVVLLNGFYSSLIHDSQVLILEALGRLERDYKGGHREESMASVERIASGGSNENDDEDDELAWSQIIRDLEDVGVTCRDAMDYRDFIVDWFVKAVNDGRLMEERREPESFANLSQDLKAALPPCGSTPTLSSAGPSLRLRPPHESHGSPAPSSVTSIENTNSLVPEVFPIQGRVSAEFSPTPSGAAQHQVPYSYYEKPQRQDVLPKPPDRPSTYRLTQTAGEIIAAWNNRDFVSAGWLLEIQLSAVERGETATLNGHTDQQPDRRLLRHLIGVCASFSGNFLKAKKIFESIMHGVDMSSMFLEDGYIAAAWWLGDICLQMHEAHNTVLAWSLAYSSLVYRHGEQNDITQGMYSRITALENMLGAVRQLEQSLRRNNDPTDIFTQIHITQKIDIVSSASNRLKKTPRTPSEYNIQDSAWVPLRTQWPPTMRLQTLPTEFLVAPFFNHRAWPLPCDPTFMYEDALLMEQSLSPTTKIVLDIAEIDLPVSSLRNAKEMHYITKKSQQWLVETVKQGLTNLGVRHREKGVTIMCRVKEQSQGLAYEIGLLVKFKKIRFRSMFGIKISEVLWATRAELERSNGAKVRQVSGRDGFIKLVQGFLKEAENPRGEGELRVEKD